MSLEELESHLATLLYLNDNMPLILDLAETVSELQDIKKALDEFPGQIAEMTAEVQALVDAAKQESEDFEQKIADAQAYWENINATLMPQLQEIKGVFTSVNVWDITTTQTIAAGAYLQIPAYNYEWSSLVLTINGTHSQRFAKVAPIDSSSPYSQYLIMLDAIPVGTVIEGITFTSPNNSILPELVEHDTTLVGDGTTENPLGLNPSTLGDITSNNTAINAIQARVVNLETDNATNKSNILSVTNKNTAQDSRLDTLETNVTALQSDNTTNQSNIAALETLTSGHTASISTLNNNLVTTNGNVASNTSRIVTLEANTVTLGTNLTTLTGRVGTNETNITNLTSRMVTVEAKATTNATNIATLQTDLDALESVVDALPTANEIPGIVEAAMIERSYVSDANINAYAAGATIDLTTVSNKGTPGSTSHAVPIVGPFQAGMMPASVYNHIVLMQSQIDALSNVPKVFINDTLPSTATQTDLDNAWTAATSDPKIEGSTLENWVDAIRWVYRGNQWYGPYSFTTVNLANTTQPGVVKSVEDIVSNNGGIFVEIDGTMTLIGYDALVASIATLVGQVGALTSQMTTVQNDTSALALRVTNAESAATTLTGRVSTNETGILTNATAITTLQDKTDTTDSNLTTLGSRITNAETTIGTHTTDISALQSSLATNDASTADLGVRMTAVETKATTNSGDIDALESRATTIETAATTLKSRVDTNETNITSLTSRMETAEDDIDTLQEEMINRDARAWLASIQLTSPYVAGTSIAVPTYKMASQSLTVFINGMRTDMFTEVDTTHISLPNGMTSPDTIQLLIDCFKV